MSNILVLGGGFGGLVTARRLALSLGSDHQVTLVAPNHNFTFYPALVELAFGQCTVEDISFDLANTLKDLGIRFVQGEMIRISPERKAVEVAGEDFRGDISYDYLVIATGRRLATEKVSGFFEHAHHLLGIKAALKFGRAVEDFREGNIVVGLSPEARLPVPVCETAFALAKKFEKERKEGNIHISVIFPEDLKSAFGGADLHKQLESSFVRHGINVHYDIPISGITKDEIRSSQGHNIKYDLLMLVPPFRGNSSIGALHITDEQDFIRVDGGMKVHGMDGAYAVGDIVAFSGPKFADMAVRQAEVAAANLIAELNGEAPTEEYVHEIATIIDAGGADSLYLHYGVWDDSLQGLRQGKLWGWAKRSHDAFWRARNK